MRQAIAADLYDADAETPRLNGTRCERCEMVSFPPMRWGCERCGADESALFPCHLAACGTVHASVTVHMHHSAEISVPFAVAEIVLDDGPLVLALLADPTDVDVHVGDRVRAVWTITAVDDDGVQLVEPRFTTTTSEPGELQ